MKSLKYLAICALTTIASHAVAQPSYANMQCEWEGRGPLRSIESSFPTTISFINTAESPEDGVAIYWVNFEGEFVLYGEVFPGQQLDISTFLTHPWYVAWMAPGQDEFCEGAYMPDPGGRVVYLQ